MNAALHFRHGQLTMFDNRDIVSGRYHYPALHILPLRYGRGANPYKCNVTLYVVNSFTKKYEKYPIRILLFYHKSLTLRYMSGRKALTPFLCTMRKTCKRGYPTRLNLENSTKESSVIEFRQVLCPLLLYGGMDCLYFILTPRYFPEPDRINKDKAGRVPFFFFVPCLFINNLKPILWHY
jgi:hypothetical protein